MENCVCVCMCVRMCARARALHPKSGLRAYSLRAKSGRTRGTLSVLASVSNS